MICEKCRKTFPIKVTIDGKRRNLKSRKYCLECSPFGRHNRKKLKDYVPPEDRVCLDCGGPVYRGKNYCNTCVSRKRRAKLRTRLFDFAGDQCVVCGYGGKEKRCALDFHHRDPTTKKFDIGVTTSASIAWEKVVEEIEKCAVLCARCHREYHGGLIPDELLAPSPSGKGVGLQSR